MIITVYKRHSADCEHKDDRNYKRCNCAVWLSYREGGKQVLRSAKTRDWAEGQAKAEVQKKRSDGGTPEAKTVAEAIALFLESKRSENLAADSIYRHEHTTGDLLNFCNSQGILFVKDITVSHLGSWRGQWTVQAPQARRSRQEKIKNFFKFVHAAGWIATNPASHLSAIKVKNDDINVRALTPKEFDKIVAATGETTMTPENAARIKVLIELQRWSGLSLVDAVCLSKDELVQDGKTFRVVLERQKTGTHINNVIPSWLGEELLKVKNGNVKFVFWSGDTTPEDAPSGFQKLYRKVFKAAGVEGSSHDFRHTFAVELLKKGADIRAVSKALGHSSVTITERFYSKWCKGQQVVLDDALTAGWEK
jgi:site-specific recombinase XerD